MNYNDNFDIKNTSGLIPVDQFNWQGMCIDPQHNPPSHLFVPLGYVYKHVCPSCGAVSFIQPQHVTC